MYDLILQDSGYVSLSAFFEDRLSRIPFGVEIDVALLLNAAHNPTPEPVKKRRNLSVEGKNGYMRSGPGAIVNYEKTVARFARAATSLLQIASVRFPHRIAIALRFSVRAGRDLNTRPTD